MCIVTGLHGRDKLWRGVCTFPQVEWKNPLGETYVRDIHATVAVVVDTKPKCFQVSESTIEQQSRFTAHPCNLYIGIRSIKKLSTDGSWK
jgi:hypothetical protein